MQRWLESTRSQLFISTCQKLNGQENLLRHSLRVTGSSYPLYDKERKAVNTSNMVKDVQSRNFGQGDKTNTEDSLKYSSRMSSKITSTTRFPLKTFSVGTKKSYLFR